MNERIRELIEQATEPPVFPANIGYFNREKFAELIVRECMEICHKLAKLSDSYVVHDGDTCATQIKKHFGVEE